MVNRPKNDGTWAETAVVNWLQLHGHPWAERRSLKGSLDRGDVTGCPGLCIEVKYLGKGVPKLAGWLKETRAETKNSRADYGYLVIKPPGVGNKRTEQWWAVMYAEDWDRLLAEVGMQPLETTVAVLSGNEVHKLAEYTHHLLIKDRVVNLLVPDMSILIRAKGVKDEGKWYRVTTLANMNELLLRAGYGSYPESPDPGKLSRNLAQPGVADERHDDSDRAGRTVEREPEDGPELHP